MSEPFTVDHFRAYCSLLVFDDGLQREPEPFQLEIAADIFRGFQQVWQVIPEGNGKTTFTAQLCLYGADYSVSPWIPVAASSTKQAKILHTQAKGFVERTPGMEARFKCLGGTQANSHALKIVSLRNGGDGIDIFSGHPAEADGVIPFPWAVVDEPHRMPDLELYRLWKGKLRKRRGQILALSTAGEPESDFERARDEMRIQASSRTRRGAHLRATGPGYCLHEWMVDKDADCSDMRKVKEANPLSSITEETLAEDFASPTLNLNDWKRLKCNRPMRTEQVAITGTEWENAERERPLGDRLKVDIGLDIGWKWDTTAAVPLWCSPDWRPGHPGADRAPKQRPVKARIAQGYRVLLAPRILVPPRDGSAMHPDVVKDALIELDAEYTVGDIVMDIHRAEDVAAWIEDELGIAGRVIDRPQGNKNAVLDYNAFMEGLRGGTLWHTGDPGLRAHALNATARRLPGGDYRFDRVSEVRQNVRAQDRRVIDALTGAAMVVDHSNRKRAGGSIYNQIYGVTAS